MALAETSSVLQPYIYFTLADPAMPISPTNDFFCLARCSFRLFPNFRRDALWGIYRDVTLPYLSAQHMRLPVPPLCEPYWHEKKDLAWLAETSLSYTSVQLLRWLRAGLPSSILYKFWCWLRRAPNKSSHLWKRSASGVRQAPPYRCDFSVSSPSQCVRRRRRLKLRTGMLLMIVSVWERANCHKRSV
jgi:hypothetical protein